MSCLSTKITEFIIEDHDLADYYAFIVACSHMGNFYFDNLMRSRPRGLKYHRDRLLKLEELGLVYDLNDASMECNHIVAYNLGDPDELYDAETITPFLEDNFFQLNNIEIIYLSKCPDCGEDSGVAKLKEKFPIIIKERKAS